MHSFLTPWSTLSLFLDQWGESGLSSVSHCPNPEERGAGVPGVRAGSLGLGRVPGVWAGSDLDTCAPRSRWPSQAPVAVSSCSKSRGGGGASRQCSTPGRHGRPTSRPCPRPCPGACTDTCCPWCGLGPQRGPRLPEHHTHPSLLPGPFSPALQSVLFAAGKSWQEPRRGDGPGQAWPGVHPLADRARWLVGAVMARRAPMADSARASARPFCGLLGGRSFSRRRP